MQQPDGLPPRAGGAGGMLLRLRFVGRYEWAMHHHRSPGIAGQLNQEWIAGAYRPQEQLQWWPRFRWWCYQRWAVFDRRRRCKNPAPFCGLIDPFASYSDGGGWILTAGH